MAANTAQPPASHSRSQLAEIEQRAEDLGTSPGWIKRENPIFWAEPRSSLQPAHWQYADARALLGDTAEVLDLALTDRRILALRNPAPGTDFASARTLSLSYQFMLPGERAPTHRHASHALRVMIDAKGTYSIVDGVRMPMETGDVVLTPGGMWHGHGHEGDQPACWVDALDIPLTHLLEPMYFEAYPGRHMEASEETATSPLRFSAADIDGALASASPDAAGRKRVVLPAPDVPTMGIAVEDLTPGRSCRPHRSTATRCVVVMQGNGTSTVAEKTFHWTAGDVLAVPAWTWFEHAAHVAARLVEISDEPLLRACRYWREETR